MDNVHDDRIPVDEALPGIKLRPFPAEQTPVEALFLIKTMAPDGTMGWSYRTSNPLNQEELLGLLVQKREVLKRHLTERAASDLNRRASRQHWR